MEQLWGGIGAVFKSWNGKRAVSYRRIEGIPDEWGTAVNVQSMVFGNMGDTSATGVAFTRNPATGENKFYGEWLVNAQGEDVVAGIRTPNPLNEATKNEQNKHLPSLRDATCPRLYKQLDDIRTKLEKHYNDMQDIEFTIQEGKLYMLQCRNGKRTGTAALNMAMDMLDEKLIDEKTAVMRVEPAQLDELLHPIVDPEAEKKRQADRQGPAGRSGRRLRPDRVHRRPTPWHAAKQGKKVILVREETNPEDVEGMRAAEGILTARGGMTSHAALVARGWGKCCIVGAGELKIDADGQDSSRSAARRSRKATCITLNGTKGHVYAGALAMIDATENPRFQEFMKMVDKFRTHGRAHQRRHARGRQGRPRVRRRGHRPVPHRAHVLRRGLRRAAVPAAQDDPQQDGRASARRRWTSCSRSSSATSRRPGGHGRPAGDHPPARPAAARVRAAGRRDSQARTGQGAGHRRRRTSRSAARRCTRPTR